MKIFQILDKILANLDNREKDIILRRYGLKGETESLSDIANSYNLSRERIRQLQQRLISQIKPLIEGEETLNHFFNQAKQFLEPIGSKPEKIFLKLIGQYFKLGEKELKIIKFFSLFSNQIIFKEGDDIFDNFYSKDLESYKIIRHSLRKIYFYFLENKEPIPEEKVIEIILKEIKTHLKKKPVKEDLIDILRILRNIDKNPFNFWGLKNHRFIQPKCLKDKIYLILKIENKPLHFIEIYRKLKNLQAIEDLPLTWLKDYNINSLRNELIRHPEFVLVKRGIYGLKEWGLIPGTAKELISQILKEKRKIDKEKLWQTISLHKQIKKSSFYVYLKQLKNVKEVNGHLIYNG